VIKNFFK